MDHDEERQALLPLMTPSLLDSIPIYSIVLDVYDLVVSRVDTSLKYEQLKSPQIHSFMIRPLVEEVREHLTPGTMYALMANMLQFSKESSSNVAMAGVSNTRAMICEILAVKLLKEYSDPDDLMNAMTYDFYPLANGNTDMRIIPRWQRISTLELAIKAEAKRFLAHPGVVQILEEIWNGSVMFQSSMHKLHRVRFENEEEVVAAGYGRRGPGVRYAYEDASLFKLSRLRVPRYRHWLNLASFCGLLCLYIMVLSQQSHRISTIECVFWLWSLGFILDEIVGFSDAGFTLYVMSLWNWFDLIILLLLLSYGGTLIASHLVVAPDYSRHLSHTAHELLATVAIFFFPRLFSILDGYEVFSYMVVSVRKMCVDLTVACLLIIVLSAGFWVAFTMAFARDVFSANKIAYDMLKILFGFTPTVWDTWQYYSVLGRIVLVFYLFITHYLIITILIAVLTNSFAEVTANAHEEHQYMFAVNTITMIKSESSSLFSYAAPLNLLEWLIRPLYYFMPLRNFLVLNRTVIKITHLPVLFLIFVYERIHLKFLRRQQLKAQEAEANRRQVFKRTAAAAAAAAAVDGKNVGYDQQQQSQSQSQQQSQAGRTLSNTPNGDGVGTPRKLRKGRGNIKQQRKKEKANTRPKVSNDDLLDEVFKRPYKGTVKVRPNIRLDEPDTVRYPNSITTSNYRTFASEVNSDPENYEHDHDDHLSVAHEADSEFDSEDDFGDEDDDDDSIIPSAGAALFHSTNSSSRIGRRHRRDSESTVQYHHSNRQSPIAMANNRTRLFSTTSSLVRHGAGMLALSPTRSTTSVLDRHMRHHRPQQGQQQRIKYRQHSRDHSANRASPVRRISTRTIEDYYNDEDDMDDDSVFKGNNMSDELQDMSRLIMSRIDTLEDGFKNMELLLSKIPDLLNSQPRPYRIGDEETSMASSSATETGGGSGSGGAGESSTQH